MINCQNCREALNPYLDRELTDDDIVHVKDHLDACGSCVHLYQFHVSLRRLVQVRCREQLAPESLRVRITEILALERRRVERRQSR